MKDRVLNIHGTQILSLIWPLPGLALAALLGCAVKIGGEEEFMTSAVESWIGTPIEDVVRYWGYPGDTRQFEGRTLYQWRRDAAYQMPQTTSVQVWGNSAVATTTGGGVLTGECTRSLEVLDGVVVVANWQGNDCPNAAVGRFKNWVKPQSVENP